MFRVIKKHPLAVAAVAVVAFLTGATYVAKKNVAPTA